MVSDDHVQFGCSAQGRFQRLEKDPDGGAGFFRAPSILLNPPRSRPGACRGACASRWPWTRRGPHRAPVRLVLAEPAVLRLTHDERGRRGVQDRPRAVDADGVIGMETCSVGSAPCGTFEAVGRILSASCAADRARLQKERASFAAQISSHRLPAFACCQRVRYRHVRCVTPYLGGAEDRKSISGQSALLCAQKPQSSRRKRRNGPRTGRRQRRAEAAQHLTNVLLPMDATPTLASHIAPHAAFVSAIAERADVVLASALFRELSQAFEKLTPLQRFSLHLSLLKHAPDTFRRRLEDSPDEWLAAAAPCVAVVAYLRRGAAIAQNTTTDQLLEVLDDNELAQSREDDAATFAASIYCVCLGLEWLGRKAYDERIANGVKRDGNILLGYDEDLTASESCVYDFAHVVSGEGFALTRRKLKSTTSSTLT